MVPKAIVWAGLSYHLGNGKDSYLKLQHDKTVDLEGDVKNNFCRGQFTPVVHSSVDSKVRELNFSMMQGFSKYPQCHNLRDSAMWLWDNTD